MCRHELTDREWAVLCPLLEALPKDIKAIVDDKGYDTNAVVERIEEQELEVVIASKKSRLTERVTDKKIYEDRNKAERFFLKVATCYDKRPPAIWPSSTWLVGTCWLK